MNTGGRPEPWAALDANGKLRPDELERPRAVEVPSRWLVSPDVDVFSPAVDTTAIEALMAVIAATPDHDFFLCSRRAKRMLALGNEGLRFAPNLWLGVPVGAGDDIWRVEDLLRCNARRPWALVEGPGDDLEGLPVAMLALVVTTGPGGRLVPRCRAAGVGYEMW